MLSPLERRDILVLTWRQRRCVHDENGRIDPVKAEQTPVPRGSAAKKRKSEGFESPSASKSTPSYTPQSDMGIVVQTAPTMPYPMGNGYQQDAPPAQQYQQQTPYSDQPLHQPQWQQPASLYPDPMDADSYAVNNGPYHQQPAELQLAYSQQTLEQLANDVLDSRYVNNDEDGGYTMPQQQQQQQQQLQSHAHALHTGGAVQPMSYPLQYQAPPQPPAQSHSSDSGVAFAEALHMLGGPVQDVKSIPEASLVENLTKHNERIPGGSTAHLQQGTAKCLLESESRQQDPALHPALATAPVQVAAQAGIPLSQTNGHTILAVTQPMHQSASDTRLPTTSTVQESLFPPQEDSHCIPPPVAVAGSVSEEQPAQESRADGAGNTAAAIVETAVVKTPSQAPKPGLSGIPLYEPPPSALQRRPSKVSQPVDLFSLADFTPPQQQNVHRRSSASKTPAPMGPPIDPVTPGSSRKRKRTSSLAAASSIKKTKIDMSEHEHAIEDKEDESAKLAKELQGQEWGLRRRSREALLQGGA